MSEPETIGELERTIRIEAERALRSELSEKLLFMQFNATTCRTRLRLEGDPNKVLYIGQVAAIILEDMVSDRRKKDGDDAVSRFLRSVRDLRCEKEAQCRSRQS